MKAQGYKGLPKQRPLRDKEQKVRDYWALQPV